MKAINLVGKLAIRTKPVILGKEDSTLEEIKDYSHMTNPIRILKVTDNHIIFDFRGTKEENIFSKKFFILDSRWNDDNWIDYEELIKDLEEKENE